MNRILAVLLLAILLTPAIARADRWLPPRPTTSVSADGSHRLTVHPGPGGDAGRAEAVMERLEGRDYRVLWRNPLTHPTAPAETVLANDGRFATLDHWGSLGIGPDVVAIHDADGRLVRRHALAGLVGEARAAGFPRSVSSVWWRQAQHIDADGVLVLELADGEGDAMWPGLVRIDMASGGVIPPQGAATPPKPPLPATPEAAVQAFHAALAAHDRPAIERLLAPDAMVLESGHVETRGEYLAHHYPADAEFARAVAGQVEDLEVRTAGEIAWAQGRSSFSGHFRDRPIRLQGAELMVLGRHEGGWRIRAIHWSSREPR